MKCGRSPGQDIHLSQGIRAGRALILILLPCIELRLCHYI